MDIEVSVRAIPPPKGVTSEQLPWKLMRVDVKNLTIEVITNTNLKYICTASIFLMSK